MVQPAYNFADRKEYLESLETVVGMKRAEIGMLIIMSGTLLGFAVLIYFSLLQVHPPEMTALQKAGSLVWQENGCMECHSILGSGGYAARDLTKTMSYRSENWMYHFFAAPPELSSEHDRIHPRLSRENVRSLISYLRFVNSINTRGWPPPGSKQEEKKDE